MGVVLIALLLLCIFICVKFGAGNDIPSDINPWTRENKVKNFEEEEEKLLLEKGRRNGK
ncbi:MAG: hypothetical protein N4A40_01345 [Tissierellales bacterium]|jgi:hypothetical protein|nr:hypothetical protein [Tissierellales bacterium]